VGQEVNNLAAVILAGGGGTRMKSRLPKALHPVLGEPMIFHILRAVARSGVPPERTLIVVGFAGEQVRQAVAANGPYLFAEQTEQLGTGHALLTAQAGIEGLAQTHLGAAENILVVYGDNPLLSSQTLDKLITTHFETKPLVTLATALAEDPTGYGRIIREAGTGRFQAIIEETHLTPEQRLIKEFNPAVYVFSSKWVWPALTRLEKTPPKGEYYLTDLLGFAREESGQPVELVPVEAEDVLGINDRVQLAQVSNIFRNRVLRGLMLQGVTIVDPASTFISAESEIGQDSLIEPNTHLRGKCRIGRDCRIGPNSILEDAQVGDNCQVVASVVQNSTLEDEVSIGPFSRIRPGSHLESKVHLGNFAEVSRSRIGTGSKQSHFSFIGDTTMGPNVNVGAGTITANYDGVNKNKTIIGARVFLGCDTILRAPVTLGEEARTGAGSVVTKNIEPGVTVVGIPARPIKRKAVPPPEPVEPTADETGGLPAS
jgi:bifunctional UDP-N-acetylglucosamine pyrophosphorylase/glucosamine-1-phosphate N-acetyltransferase